MDARNVQFDIFFKTFIYIFLTVPLFSCNKNPSPDPDVFTSYIKDGTVFLGQGWDTQTRQKISYISFGSRVMNYDWFMALEQFDSENLFRKNSHMQLLGFITEPASAENPDGLPVGMSRDEDDSANIWMGLTCAACHTGELIVKNQRVRIDGGQSLLNYSQFEDELLAALKATLAQPEKWQRFVSRLHEQENNRSQKLLADDLLKQSVQQHILFLEKRYSTNASAVPYGHGRLDAFGQIFNAVTVDALNILENKHSPDAPTSFPFLWDASHLDIVQWNASAPNKEPGPLFQNATTAMAVYGTVNVLDQGMTYSSSTKILNLGFIQKQFYQLVAPRWPENIIGKLDEKLIESGKSLYQNNCSECHSVSVDKNPKRKLNAVMVPLEKVGTDRRMADNFANAKVKTGELEGKRMAVFFGEKIGKEESAIDVVMHVTGGTLARHPIDSIRSIITQYAENNSAAKKSETLVYKARPLNGVWATAPFLHNGSVPTIYDLLLPASERPKQFYVGNREFDDAKLGNSIEAVEGSSLFNTNLPGNMNVGHEYGIQLSATEKKELLEYVKSL